MFKLCEYHLLTGIFLSYRNLEMRAGQEVKSQICWSA